MSCWVVPSIAAEFWGIPLEQVMDRINRFAVRIRRENGFTFVDVLPDPASDKPLPTFTAAQAQSEIIDSDEFVEIDPSSEILPVTLHPMRMQTATQRRAPMAA
ncbi:MAG TPA: hypothetical protein VFE58_03695 [Tepidisphaeraceae bacterium]|jgi:hypothetical protein|nr:hypothetical protein [Tepidisphaeraceae bacterium]